MDGESVPSLVVADSPAGGRVRWWRRRPPAPSSRLSRGVWWVGQAQLFIAVTLGVFGPVSLAAAFLDSNLGVIGWLGTAMALPFAISGRMLRAYGAEMGKSTQAVGWQVLELTAVVIVIAVLAIALVFVCAFALILLFGLLTPH